MLYLKRIIAAAGVLAVFVGIWCGLRYLLSDDTSSYTRIMMHEFYAQDNIDVLFCGASLCYRSFDTNVLDETMNLNTFNVGSSSQDIDTTYFIIDEAIHRNKIKQIVLELSPIMAQNIDIPARKSSGMLSVYLIADYMKWSPRKVSLLLNSSSSDQYSNNFLVARRNWGKIQDAEYVSNLLTTKKEDVYKNYQYDWLQHDSEWYAGKGYVESNYRIVEKDYRDSYMKQTLDVENINEDWHVYLDKIINCCSRNHVELIITCAPLSGYLLSCYGEAYDDYHDMLSEIARNADIEFWDFSLFKEQYLPLDASFYKDSAHLNMYGAEIFSKLIAEMLLEEKSANEMCYESTQQKVQEWESQI